MARAKDVFFRNIDAAMAIELESCLHCGMCAYACHFYTGTHDPKYVPVMKYKLVRRFYRRELGPHRWFYRLVTRDITAEDLTTDLEGIVDLLVRAFYVGNDPIEALHEFDSVLELQLCAAPGQHRAQPPGNQPNVFLVLLEQSKA